MRHKTNLRIYGLASLSKQRTVSDTRQYQRHVEHGCCAVCENATRGQDLHRPAELQWASLSTHAKESRLQLAGGPMPYFNFDLIVGDELRSQGGMILENAEGAIDKADSLASELCIARPELRSRGFSVRVVDGDSHELYRTPVNPRS
jgi:hypothetical protein